MIDLMDSITVLLLSPSQQNSSAYGSKRSTDVSVDLHRQLNTFYENLYQVNSSVSGIRFMSSIMRMGVW